MEGKGFVIRAGRMGFFLHVLLERRSPNHNHSLYIGGSIGLIRPRTSISHPTQKANSPTVRPRTSPKRLTNKSPFLPNSISLHSEKGWLVCCCSLHFVPLYLGKSIRICWGRDNHLHFFPARTPGPTGWFHANTGRKEETACGATTPAVRKSFGKRGVYPPSLSNLPERQIRKKDMHTQTYMLTHLMYVMR